MPEQVILRQDAARISAELANMKIAGGGLKLYLMPGDMDSYLLEGNGANYFALQRGILYSTPNEIINSSTLTEIGGAVTPPPVTPTIVISSLSPNTAPKNTSQTVAVLGTNLQPGDTVVWAGGSVGTNYVYSGQVTTDPVNTGPTARTVMVHISRVTEVSNELPFTVT